jgi:hypothetical protein
MTPLEQAQSVSAVERYYRFHSKIYDATRWSLSGDSFPSAHCRNSARLRGVVEVLDFYR